MSTAATYGSSIIDIGQIQCLTSRNLDVVQDNLGATGRALSGLGGCGEGTSRRLLGQIRHARRGRGSSDDGAQRSQAKKLNGTHDE
jgi:hypothetical protein